MDYAKKAINTIRELPQGADGVLLWEVPESDFAAYLAMPDTPQVSYGRYLALVAAIQADVERSGKVVRRVRIPVATMVSELARHGWSNDTKHRAKVIGLLGARERYS
jgi:hypothetical protein